MSSKGNNNAHVHVRRFSDSSFTCSSHMSDDNANDLAKLFDSVVAAPKNNNTLDASPPVNKRFVKSKSDSHASIRNSNGRDPFDGNKSTDDATTTSAALAAAISKGEDPFVATLKQQQDLSPNKQHARAEHVTQQLPKEDRQIRLKWRRKKVVANNGGGLHTQQSLTSILQCFGEVEEVEILGGGENKGNVALITFVNEASCKPCVDAYRTSDVMRAKFVGGGQRRKEAADTGGHAEADDPVVPISSNQDTLKVSQDCKIPEFRPIISLTAGLERICTGEPFEGSADLYFKELEGMEPVSPIPSVDSLPSPEQYQSKTLPSLASPGAKSGSSSQSSLSSATRLSSSASIKSQIERKYHRRRHSSSGAGSTGGESSSRNSSSSWSERSLSEKSAMQDKAMLKLAKMVNDLEGQLKEQSRRYEDKIKELELEIATLKKQNGGNETDNT